MFRGASSEEVGVGGLELELAGVEPLELRSDGVGYGYLKCLFRSDDLFTGWSGIGFNSDM